MGVQLGQTDYLPGWYGFGAAVKAWLDAHPAEGMSILQAMYGEWPFFQTTLSNMDMVLAKSDIAIASRYAELVPERELRDEIFQQLRSEWQTSIDMLLAITGQQACSSIIRCNGIAAGLRNSG